MEQPSRVPLPGIGKLLDESWGQFARHFFSYAAIQAIPAVLLFILLATVGGSAFLQNGGIAAHGSGGIVESIVIIVIVIVLYIWSTVSLAYAVTHQEEALSITDAFRKGWGKIGSYLWIGILTGLITMVGFILLVVPGIIFSIWYLFGTMVFLTEGDRGQKALEKSKAYVRGYWWAIAGRQIILGIIILCLNILAAIATLAAPGNALASQATQLIIQILYGPFAVVYLYRLYLQLRAVKPSTSYPLT